MKLKTYIDKLGISLAERLKLDKPGKGKQELQQELIALSKGSRSAVKEYYARKLLSVLAVLIVGSAACLICLLVYGSGRGQTVLESLLRPGYGEGDKKTELSVQVEDDQKMQDIEITVSARKYTDQEKRKILDTAVKELEELILGENESLDHVQYNLNFPSVLQDGIVSVRWNTDPYGVIKDDGTIISAEDENGTLVKTEAVLSCEDIETVYTFYVNIFPPDMTQEERFWEAVIKEVERADEQSSHEESIALPQSVEGKRLTWRRVSDNPAYIVFAMTLLLAFCVYLEMDNQVHKKAEERKNQMLLDYPDLMWKMTMLMGAGMSIRGSFTKIADEYTQAKKAEAAKGKKDNARRYVYEEVVYTCLEMQSGIGEASAYERFGKRCQLPEYIRIGSILSQNLRKGAKGLTALLESEAESSLNDRKNHARKIGEQAGTKLLLPMVLMLAVVLVVLMVPAFLSF